MLDAQGGVEKHDHLQRLVGLAGKVGDLLRDAVFEDFEILLLQIEWGVGRSSSFGHDDVNQIAVDANGLFTLIPALLFLSRGMSVKRPFASTAIWVTSS